MRLHNRQIKAGFWNDGDLLSWPMAKRMFYLGLIQLSDDSGCLEDRPRAMRHEIFQSEHDEHITIEQVAEWVQEFIDEKKIVRYTVGRKTCLFLVNFHKHQKLRTPAPPETPLPDWITWESFPSNSRTGKYVVNTELLTECLQSAYAGLTMFFQPEPEHEPEEEEKANVNGAHAPSIPPSKKRSRRAGESDVILELAKGVAEGQGMDPEKVCESTFFKNWAPYLLEAHGKGYIRSDMYGCARWLKTDPFWQPKVVTAKAVVNQVAGWVGMGRPGKCGEVANAPPEVVTEREQRRRAMIDEEAARARERIAATGSKTK